MLDEEDWGFTLDELSEIQLYRRGKWEKEFCIRAVSTMTGKTHYFKRMWVYGDRIQMYHLVSPEERTLGELKGEFSWEKYIDKVHNKGWDN